MNKLHLLSAALLVSLSQAQVFVPKQPENGQAGNAVQRLEKRIEVELRQMDHANMQGGAWRIGIAGVPVSDDLRAHLDLPPHGGLVVQNLMDHSPAKKAGLVANDIITHANEKPVASVDELRPIVMAVGGTGQTLKLKVLRKGKPQVITIEAPKINVPPAPKEGQARDGQAQGGQRPDANPMFRNPQATLHVEEMQKNLRRLNEMVEKQQRQIEELRKELKKKDKE